MSHNIFANSMAVGGGDAFSLPATCLTIVLLWSLIQVSAPYWLPELARRHPDNISHYQRLEKSLTWVPAGLILLASIDLVRAHFAGDMTYAHVAAPTSQWVALALFGLTPLITERRLRCSLLDDDEIFVNLRARTLRWTGFFWPVILMGYIPNDTFAVFSQPILESGLTASTSTLLAVSAGAVALGFWTHSIARDSQLTLAGKLGGLEVIALGSFAFATLFFAADSFDPQLPVAEAISLNDGKFLLVSTLLIPLLAWPLHLSLTARVHSLRGIAVARRWLGLQRTIGHTLVFAWLSGLVLLEPLPSIAGWHSAAWVSFTLIVPLALCGLLTSLLPLMGVDARPRPEVWGFNLGLMLAIPLLTIREPLSALLVPGLFVSMTTTPLLATHPEKRPELSVHRRGFESMVIIGFSLAALYFFHRTVHGEPFAFYIAVLMMLAPLFFAMTTNLQEPLEKANSGEQE